MIYPDRALWTLYGGIAVALTIASIAGEIARRRMRGPGGEKFVRNLVARVNAWWVMVIVLAIACTLGEIGVVLLFAFVSFLALREMMTLTPTRRGDHRALFWAFFVVLPVQYTLIYTRWLDGFWTIFIPVYASLFLAIRGTLAGDASHYMERTAKIQWGVLICVYCVSAAPAIMMLNLDVTGPLGGVKLLLYFLIVVQSSDVLQYVWGKSFGKHKIAPLISPSKTVEGFIGGVLSATLVGAAMYQLTPFSPLAAAGISLMTCLMGFGGGLVMSAVKRDAGVKDFGDFIAGHGGMMDRIDSLSFAAPIFFHVVGFCYRGST